MVSATSKSFQIQSDSRTVGASQGAGISTIPISCWFRGRSSMSFLKNSRHRHKSVNIAGSISLEISKLLISFGH